MIIIHMNIRFYQEQFMSLGKAQSQISQVQGLAPKAPLGYGPAVLVAILLGKGLHTGENLHFCVCIFAYGHTTVKGPICAKRA